MFYVLLIVTVIISVIAVKTNKLIFKIGVTFLCSLMTLWLYFIQNVHAYVFFIIAAFLSSMVGDYFLSNKGRNKNNYTYGIAGYFAAHAGYLAFAAIYGGFDFIAVAALIMLTAGYTIYFILRVKKEISNSILLAAVFFYTIISCICMSLSLNTDFLRATKGFYALGIMMILISDTLIAESDFCSNRRFSRFILPTYYFAQISITVSILFLFDICL